MPIWKDDLLSPFTPNGISNHHLTKYYQYASSNNHIVLGDYNVLTTELDGNQGRKTLYLEQLPAGVYTYFVKCGEYTITGKLMKK